MSDYFLGEVRMFGGNFAPVDWAFCNGQILSIAQYTALFSLIGTTYGGDGVTTFALPNMQSRVPMHYGQGPGLSPRVMGEMAGTEEVTLLLNQMPAHNHMALASLDTGSLHGPDNTAVPATPAAGSGAVDLYATTGANPLTITPMAPQMIGIDGGGLPHDNMMPYLCVSFIIALQGLYPSRN